MDTLLRYQLTDGLVVGVWQGTHEELLTAQVVPDDPTHGYLRMTTEESPQALMEGWYVQEGALVPKAVLTVHALPNPFTADGVTMCHITVTPFVSCTLVVDGQQHALTEADDVLELTADIPHVFQVSLLPMGAYRADPLHVEAQ